MHTYIKCTYIVSTLVGTYMHTSIQLYPCYSSSVHTIHTTTASMHSISTRVASSRLEYAIY